MEFKIGQKVVCVKNGRVKNTYKVGVTYTIIDIKMVIGEPSLFFKEIHNGSETRLGGYNYYGHNPKNFNPIELDYDFVEEVIKQVQPKEI